MIPKSKYHKMGELLLLKEDSVEKLLLFNVMKKLNTAQDIIILKSILMVILLWDLQNLVHKHHLEIQMFVVLAIMYSMPRLVVMVVGLKQCFPNSQLEGLLEC